MLEYKPFYNSNIFIINKDYKLEFQLLIIDSIKYKYNKLTFFVCNNVVNVGRSDMPKKIMIVIDDILNKRLWNYINKTYSDESNYGKLKKVVTQAITDFLEKKDF